MDRIVAIDHRLVRAPFREPIAWGSGARTGATRLICRIQTESGVVGWGETQALIDVVPAAFEHAVKPIGLGYPITDASRLHAHVMGAGYYHHKRAAVMAVAALEMAMWDALGKRLDAPLHALWGGARRRAVRAAAYLFTADDSALTEKIGAFIDAGHDTFKIKIGFDAASDRRLATNARAAIGARELRLDVNGAWTRATAKRQLAALAHLDPAYVEQPLELSDLRGSAELRRGSSIPIALDESAYTLTDVGAILAADAADVLLLDPHQAGGLWQCLKAAASAEAAGVPVGLHSGGELAISQAAYLHLAATIPNLVGAIDTERRYLGADVSRSPPPLSDGAFEVPERPGLGVDVDEDMLRAIEVDDICGAYLDPARPGWFPTKPAY